MKAEIGKQQQGGKAAKESSWKKIRELLRKTPEGYSPQYGYHSPKNAYLHRRKKKFYCEKKEQSSEPTSIPTQQKQEETKAAIPQQQDAP